MTTTQQTTRPGTDVSIDADATYFALLDSSTRKNATSTCHGIVSGATALQMRANSTRPELLRFVLQR